MHLKNIVRRSARLALALVVAILSVAMGAGDGSAQTCTACDLYAATELNLRQEPSLEAEVLRFIPAGAIVQRTEAAEVDGYAPVIYDEVPGWAIAAGLVASPEEVEGVGGPAAPIDAPATGENVRVTLAPLVLRGEPSAESEPILVMPEGATITLTGEGADNGYVTVDYDGTPGWAYAELLGGEP